MKLKIPELNPVLQSESDQRRENRYLAHCGNIALILAYTDSVAHAKARIEEYSRITNAEQEEPK
ncbi:unnamed protein product [marine sediment metagenome]|uniref:Uncharacterized protein n=1 Tax=marine sediment metagenome TaxID=412755 RepID=X0VUQ1_9ZZZZ